MEDRANAEPPVRAGSTGSLNFGKYRLIASIGHGGMADVFLAVSSGPAGFSKLQVIKQLRPVLADEPELRTMFLDEARLAARLNHKNVVQTNEVGVEDDTYFIAMEYLDGQPLSRVLHHARKTGHPFPMTAQLRVLCEMLGGLHYAHELTDYDGTPLNIVHRDVTPQNVFLTYDGQVKLVDFGIAKAEGRESETKAGVIKGKIAYMAPEQAFAAHTQAPVDRRADVYAAGVMLWEAIAGRRLFKGLGDAKMLAELIKGAPKIEEVVPDVAPELARISALALARDPKSRYASAADLKADLERFLAGTSERVTPEELGAMTSDMFAEQRAEMRTILDRQLAEIRTSRAAARDGGGRGVLSQDGRTPTDAFAVSASMPAGPLSPIEAAAVSGAIPKLPIPASSLAPPSSLGPDALTLPSAPVTGAPPAARGARRGAMIALAGLAGVGLAAGLGWSFAASRTPPSLSPAAEPAALAATLGRSPSIAAAAPSGAAPASDPSTLAASPAPQAPPRPDASGSPAAALPDSATVRVVISVNPAEGRILVDGARLPANPFDGRFARDGAVHRVQIEAPGFLSQSRLVVFDKDVAQDIVLLPRPKAQEAASPSAPSAPSAPSGAAKPNPYGD